MADAEVIVWSGPDELRPFLVPVGGLGFLPGNPRRGDVEAVAASYARFGQQKPVVAKDGIVIAGNTQLAAARSLEWTHLAVLNFAGDADAAHAFAIADNRTSELGTTDLEALVAFLQETPDLGGTGYEPADLTDLLAELDRTRPPVEGLTDPNAVVTPPAEPQTKPGDLWILGGHRLLCGDATNAEDVARVLDGATPGVMVTDPPYGVSYDPQWREKAGLSRLAPTRTEKVANDDRDSWGAAWALFPGDVLYVWHSALHAVTVAADLAGAGFEMRAQIIWVKPYAPISRGAYHWRHEPCWYAVRKGRSAGWAGDRKQTTVIEATSPNDPYGRSTLAAGEAFTNHGTQKPVEVMEMPIRNHRGDVYDPFLGSGTSLIAAQRTGRRCFALDVDPAYVDVAVQRWEAFTGEKALRG